MASFKLYFLVFVGLTAVCSEEVTIKLFATDLAGCESLSKCDAFVKIYCQNRLSDWKLCGQTSVKNNDNFPIWPESFTFDYTIGNRDKWDFKIIDQNVGFNTQIASVELSTETFINATSAQFTYIIPLPEVKGGAAKLYVERY